MAALIGMAALLLEVVYPALGSGRGGPSGAILFTGVVDGSLWALTAVALILVFRISRIINFAQVALGSAAGYFLTQMAVGYDLPTLAMIPAALLLAVMAGVLAELALRRFSRSPRLFVTIATITLAPAATLVMAQIISSLNPLPAGSEAAARTTLLKVPVPFPGFSFRIDGIPFSFAYAFGIGAAALALLCVGAFLTRSRQGRVVRAVADNAEGAALLGVNTRLVSTLVWGLAALLSGLVSVTSLMLHGIDPVGRDGGASALIPPLVAAMVAGFESIPLAAFFAVWLAVMRAGTSAAFPNAGFVEPSLLAIAALALIARRRALQARERNESGVWEGVRSLNRVPRALMAVPGIRRARALGIVAVALLSVLFPFIASPGELHGGGLALVYVIAAVSLLIVVGWLGQINLRQFALVAAGAVVTGGLSNRLGLSFWLVMPAACLVGAGAAVLLGVVALRVQGLWLAPVSLVLAATLPVVLFNQAYLGWLLPRGLVERPGLPVVDLNDEKTFYYLLLAGAAAVVLVAWRFRSSRWGRSVLALRDNEPAALAAGIAPLRSRVMALALSGLIAAFAGALLSVHERRVEAQSFGLDISLNLFIMVVLGGLG
ncbi:MAG: ABC transporter permease, partial [Candidatus Dormibacteria bacterium]